MKTIGEIRYVLIHNLEEWIYLGQLCTLSRGATLLVSFLFFFFFFAQFGPTLKERICFSRSKFLTLRVEPFKFFF